MAISSSISPMQTALSPQANTQPIGYAPASNDTSGGFDSVLGNTLGNVLGAGASIYGAQNAAEAQNNGILAGIGTQQQTMGNINSLWTPQTSVGNAAVATLGNTLGVGGGPANYSNFYNMPGYQFAVQQGTQAINRQAAAAGSLYTPNTLDAVGQYVTGTASQNYNNYISQLLQTAGLSTAANTSLTGANLQTGGNISQLQQNSGNAQASGQAAVGSQIGSLVKGLFGSGANGSGLGANIASGVGNVASGLNYNGTYSPDLSGLAPSTSDNQNANYNLSADQLASNSDAYNLLNSGNANSSGTTDYGSNSGP
jgi:hypothetical protein